MNPEANITVQNLGLDPEASNFNLSSNYSNSSGEFFTPAFDVPEEPLLHDQWNVNTPLDSGVDLQVLPPNIRYLLALLYYHFTAISKCKINQLYHGKNTNRRIQNKVSVDNSQMFLFEH